MEIKWNNVIYCALAIFVFVLVVKMHEEIVAFLGCMKEVGPGHTVEEKTFGLMAYGLAVVTVFGLLKILSQRNRGE